MHRIAIYGKGGIGKSTTCSNISEALAEAGHTVMQIGCDPKADSTMILTQGKKVKTVLDAMSEGDPELEDIVTVGSGGVLCVECGGPKPGTGCAGRGIIAAFGVLQELDAMKIYSPDVLIYDVLGDVVCGGFAMPIRNGYARDVFVVTSGELMSLYAAENIAQAVSNLSDSGYARFGGIIQNSRNVEDEDATVDRTAAKLGTDILGRIPRDPSVQRCEKAGKTVVSGEPDSAQAKIYRSLAGTLLERSENLSGGMCIGQKKGNMRCDCE